jgi:stress response protein YsnF
MNSRSREDAGTDSEDASSSSELIRHEQELDVTSRSTKIGGVRVRTDPEAVKVERSVPRHSEVADVRTTNANERDSGEVETLPDGSISIPIFEEQLVVTRRRRVRERLIVKKRTVTHHEMVRGEVVRERVSVEPDEGIEVEEEIWRDENANETG